MISRIHSIRIVIGFMLVRHVLIVAALGYKMESSISLVLHAITNGTPTKLGHANYGVLLSKNAPKGVF